MSQEECNICVSYFNKSTRKKVKCPYCNYEVCSECIKTMMIENGESCPDCKKGWNKEFIKDNTTKVWFDGPYKDNCLFDGRPHLGLPPVFKDPRKMQAMTDADRILLENQTKEKTKTRELHSSLRWLVVCPIVSS